MVEYPIYSRLRCSSVVIMVEGELRTDLELYHLPTVGATSQVRLPHRTLARIFTPSSSSH
jgi:hypothetical protein